MRVLGTLAAVPLVSVAAIADGALTSNAMSGKRVAVIGAGAAGSSTAYHLSRLSPTTNTTVYDANSYIGGRTTTVNAWGDPSTPIELGGSIFVAVNEILYSSAQKFNLPIKGSGVAAEPGQPDIGVWNGREFVLESSGEGGWWDIAKLLWRYGLAPIKTDRAMKRVVGQFLKMYEAPVFPFSSLSAAVQEVGLVEHTGVTGEQFLESEGVSDKYATEVVQASTRVNYAQNLPLLHGLETMVCMAASGAMAIKGGNWRIFEAMLKSSERITTHLNTSIARISKQPDGTYALTTSTGSTSIFDTVVLAAPLQFSSIVIDPAPQHVPDQIPYVELHVTLFASPHPLSPLAFGLAPDKLVPQYVLTTLPPGEHTGTDPHGAGSAGFFSVSTSGVSHNPYAGNRREYIYKIFSPEKATSAFLSKILGVDVPDTVDADVARGERDGDVTWIHRKVWHPYPYMYPRVTFDEIKLDEGLYYTSGIEPFIGTMETSALMGKNVAQLIADSWAEGVSEAQEQLQVQGGEEWNYQGAGREEQKPLKAKL